MNLLDKLQVTAIAVFLAGWFLDIGTSLLAFRLGFAESNPFWASHTFFFVLFIPLAGTFALFIQGKLSKYFIPLYVFMLLNGIVHLFAAVWNLAIILVNP